MGFDLYVGIQVQRGFLRGLSVCVPTTGGIVSLVVVLTGGVVGFAALPVGGLVLSRLLGCKE